MFWEIWIVSFLVGVRMSVWVVCGRGCCWFCFRWCNSGKINVVVFLVLVCVMLSRLCFFSCMGMVFDWIGVRVEYFVVVIVCLIDLDNLSEEKVEDVNFFI